MVKAPPWGYQFQFIGQGIAFLGGMFSYLFGSRIAVMLIGVFTAIFLLVVLVRYFVRR